METKYTKSVKIKGKRVVRHQLLFDRQTEQKAKALKTTAKRSFNNLIIWLVNEEYSRLKAA